MATAELIQNLPAAAVKEVVPIFGGSARGATQDYTVTVNSQRHPVAVFFAPAGDRRVLTDYWGDLLHSTVRPVYVAVPRGFFAGQSVIVPWLLAAEAPYASLQLGEINAVGWDRLGLELMRIASLEPNWDGEGAEAVASGSVINAQVLMRLAREAVGLSSIFNCPLPRLNPSADGGITVKWLFNGKELKCTAYERHVEIIRWRSSDRFESDGFWEVPAQKATEHFNWLLK